MASAISSSLTVCTAESSSRSSGSVSRPGRLIAMPSAIVAPDGEASSKCSPAPVRAPT